jgi:hypothetical protein
MLAAAKWEREKRELDALLSSGIFDRAPSLASLLTYICRKYFEGDTDAIKEYNLAVEALGRPPDFDQKRDSIVRVEVHRLRKRLQEHYAREGAGRDLRLVIPTGQYAPKFIEREPQVTPGAPPARHRAPGRRAPLWIFAAAMVLATGAALSIALFKNAGADVPRAPVAATAAPAASGNDGEVRILAGSDEPYVDRFGRIWLGDRYYRGGERYSSPNQKIIGESDATIYRSRREGEFQYDIPLAAGVYELRLHFAEMLYGDGNAAGGGESTRIFSVKANGQVLIPTLDVIADVGPSAADVRVFKDIAPDSDGKLHLKFEGVTNPAFVSAIEITPGTRGRMRPLRIVAQSRAYKDPRGVLWMADRYFAGGRIAARDQSVTGAPDPGFFGGERFGNIIYSIPVAPGRYAVKLYFAERWFGPGKPGGGGAGDRVFDILCNGVALARGFDIYREAGGSDRAVVKTFRNLEPTAQGRLRIELQPRRNYAAINAIEIVDESEYEETE